jgi:MFS family permease
VSLILSLLIGLMFAMGPLSSAICNRIGCQTTTIIGAIIAYIGYECFREKLIKNLFRCAISCYANSMEFLIVSVGIIMGSGFGLMYCPAIVIVTMYFERLRALAMGVTVCGAGVGTIVFLKVISSLVIRYNWQIVLYIYAGLFSSVNTHRPSNLGLALLCVPCGMLYRPIEFEPIYDDEEEEMIEIKKNDNVDHPRSLELHRQELIADEDKNKASPHLIEDKKEPRMIKKMIDLSLFEDPVFLLFAFSHFLTTIGFTLSRFVPLHARALGFSTSDVDITINVYSKRQLLC